MKPANDTASASTAIVTELRARGAADQARHAARLALTSKVREDALRAGDLFRCAGALYTRAARMWETRGPEDQTFAEHCAQMAARLSASPFAQASLAATY